MAFPIALGFALILEGGMVAALGSFAFAAAIVGYNGSMRLVVGEEICLSRYGFKLWRIRASRVCVTSGRTGELAILPAYILTDPNGGSGAIPKGMLRPNSLASFKSVIEQRQGVWKA